MNFSKLLDCEAVLGKRGDKNLINFYSLCHKAVTRTDMGFAFDRNTSEGQQIFKMNEAQQSHIFITYKFRKETPRAYYIPKDFAQALSKINPTLPSTVYPERFFGYIHFAEDALIDRYGDSLVGAYVYIGEGKETPITPDRHHLRYVWTCLIFKPNKTPLPSVAYILSEIKDGQIGEWIDQLDQVGGTMPIDRDIIKTIINTSLYINSVDADLLKLPELPKNISQTKKKKLAEKTNGIINECTVPVTLVSWSYQKPRQYSIDQTFVETHMRWQRCGPQFSQIKLIWVKEHQRTYTTKE